MFNAGGVRHEPAEILGRDHGQARRQKGRRAVERWEGISANGAKRVWFDKVSRKDVERQRTPG